MAITHKTPTTLLTKDSLNETDREWFEERAGILEFDAHYPRDVAEQKALEMLLEYKKSHSNGSGGFSM